MEGFGQIFNLLIAIYGFRCFYDWLRQHSAGRLQPSPALCPNGKRPSDCRDAEAYYRKIMPVYLLFSVCTALCGSLNIAQSILKYPGLEWMPLALLAVFIVSTAAFGICLKRLIAKYW